MFGRDDNKVKVSNSQISTFIGADTSIEGKLITNSSVRIDGTVIGGVIAAGTVVLSESGQIQGDVIAENIVVSGVVDGNMAIKDKVNIEPTGEVYGDITTRKILVDEESVFQGKCNMNRDKEQEKKRRRGKEEIVYSEPVYSDPVYESPVYEDEMIIEKQGKAQAKKSRKSEELHIEVLDEDQDLETIDIDAQ